MNIDYVGIAFAIFAGCCLAQFWFYKQVRDRLIDNHPEAYLDAERSSWFPGAGMWNFIKGNAYKELRDEELSRRVRNLKLLFLVTFLAWLSIAVSIALVPVE